MQNTTIRKKSILFIKNAILFPAGVFDFWAIERKPLLLKTIVMSLPHRPSKLYIQLLLTLVLVIGVLFSATAQRQIQSQVLDGIYGSRAAAGVIIITTKHALAGTATIDACTLGTTEDVISLTVPPGDAIMAELIPQ